MKGAKLMHQPIIDHQFEHLVDFKVLIFIRLLVYFHKLLYYLRKYLLFHYLRFWNTHDQIIFQHLLTWFKVMAIYPIFQYKQILRPDFLDYNRPSRLIMYLH